MKLNKRQREQVRMRFGGRCAYCGSMLGDRWHADHLEPIRRRLIHVSGGGFVPTGESDYPERDTIENIMPACAPCNIDKHSMALEDWRRKLQDACGVLARNQPTYRHAKRFGLVLETGAQVTFYFESPADQLKEGE